MLNNNKTILICDDDEGIADVARIVLEDKGYRIETLTQSHCIFDKINELMPDLILLDLWMPNLSGEEITKRLKADIATKSIPVIIVSASNKTKQISAEIGADNYLCKPFDITELEKMVENYI